MILDVDLCIENICTGNIMEISKNDVRAFQPDYLFLYFIHNAI